MGPHAHPEISLHGFSFAEHVRLLERGDWDGVAGLLLRSAEKLASVGASFAICPDNTAHQAFPEVERRSPIPWVHIADAVIEEAKRRGVTRLGVLGTSYLMEGPVYAERLSPAGLQWCTPEPRDRERINEIIFGDLVYGRVTPGARDELRRILGWLRSEKGCDSVVLGCTELPLAVTGDVSPLPTLDSTRLLARMAVARAVSELKADA
jgi:aspartate racemase